MHLTIGEIAEVFFGLHTKSEKSGTVKYLMSSHFDEINQPSEFDNTYVGADVYSEKWMLQPNDVILASKGYRNLAWAYEPEFGLTVPSSIFFVLKPDERVNAKYLALALNSNEVQHQFDMIGGTATVKSIPKKHLIQIPIPVPPLEEQMKIVEMAELLDKNIKLTQQLLTKKMELKSGVLNRILNQFDQ